MRQIGIMDLVTLSIDRTKKILFQPFSFKKWMVLLFIACLAGVLGGSSSGGGGGSNDSDENGTQVESSVDHDINVDISVDAPEPFTSSQAPRTHFIAQMNPLAVNTAEASSPYEDKVNALQEASLGQSDSVMDNILSGPVILIAILSVGIAILFMWLGTRFKFIWYHAIVNNDTKIVEPWHSYKEQGNSLFKTYLLVMLFFVFWFIVNGFWIYNILNGGGVALEEFFSKAFFNYIGKLILPIILNLGLLLAAVVATVYVEHFVTTIMAMDRCSFLEAWKKFVNVFKMHVNDFLIYLVSIFCMGFVTMILYGLGMVIVLVIFLLSGAIIFGSMYALFALLLKSKLIFGIFAVCLGIPFFLGLILVLLMLCLPIAVLFKNFSFYFLSSLQCGYAPLSLEESSS